MLKAFTKLSKELLLDMCKPKYESNKQLSLQPEYKDFRKCKRTCPWYYNNRNTCEICTSCPFVLSTSSIKVPRKNALTYSQIKQLLLYHALVFDNNGLTPELNNEYVANMINCTPKTARDNLKSLEAAGYIATSNKVFSSYVVYIIDYHKYHVGNNRGYLNINKRVLNAILQTDSINELRLALYCVVKLDDIRKFKKTIKKFTYESLINILPSYIYNKEQIKDIFVKLSDSLNLFNISFEEECILISETNMADNHIFKKGVHNKNKKALKAFLTKHKLKVNKKEMNDLLQMFLQYNSKIVLNSLNLIKDKKPRELGSYLRTIIRKNIISILLSPSFSAI